MKISIRAAWLQDGKVKPDLGHKALVDAIRVTSRNTFWLAHAVFRPCCKDFQGPGIFRSTALMLAAMAADISQAQKISGGL